MNGLRLVALAVAVGLALRAADQDADQTLAAAQAARNAGRLEESERLSREALKLRPNWGLADYNLALTRMLGGDAAGARQGFLKAYREDPKLEPALLFAGVASHNLADYTGADDYFRRYLKLRPNDPQAHYYAGANDVSLGEYSRAALEYLKQAEVSPARADIYYELSECYLTMAGATLEALPSTPDGLRFRKLAIAADAGPDAGQFPEHALRAARSRLSSGDLQGASSLLAHAAGKNADCPVLENAGDALLALGDISGALNDYRKAMARWPGCIEQPPAGVVPADRLTAQSADDRRVIDFELPRLRGADPHAASRPCSGADGMVGRASCFASRGDLQKATAALAAASATDARAIYWTFEIYGEMARRAAARLSQLAPDSYLLAEMTGEALELEGLPEQAEAQYRMAMRDGASDARPAVACGRFLCKMGRFDDALPVLQEALRRDSANVEADALAAEACLRTNRDAEAIPYLRVVVRARPSDAMPRIDLAHALDRTGKTQEAVALLEATPNDRDGRAHYVLAGFYRRLGRPDDAKRALAEFQKRRATAATPQGVQ